ncbi:Coenzyme F420 hydrogenase/dehydrogenase, beta subunit C-terminal domain [Paraprevotella clara]|uniref:4Fe-4S binding domain protein n=1 Tax=Paraprevotella clara YIT 11840 TaxID=762968 RepID=G5SM29_9BACT|nr:Coenzyme F420 hydrogenase/dehydrogenase, beta subunit C-terminal domain [Paraprevotella clara]EHH01587.1 4Fe-4S binding domain protein [Paraprevotella clara YIT 11840]
MKKNVSWVVHNGLCTSCGICIGACAKKAISFIYGKERNIPTVNVKLCVNCGVCYKICPGKGCNINSLSKKLFNKENGINKNLYIGHYLKTYVGHSTNEDLRYHAATGGMVTQFLTYLLEKKLIDGAVVVGYSEENPFEAKPFIAKNAEEIHDSKSSKYVVTSMDKVVTEILNTDLKRLAMVGLPCHIQGMRKLAEKNRLIHDKIAVFAAIYCSVNKTRHSLDYYLYRYKVNKNDVGKFSFRDDGCMGFMKFTDKNGNTIKKVPYMSYWFGTHSFFANSRCSLCIDQLGELADISFGDIHIKPYSNDQIGTNSIITRSSYWDKLLQECHKEGYIMLDEISAQTLVSSQTYTISFKKGGGVKTNFMLRKLVGKRNPIYDSTPTARISLKNLVTELSKCIMRKIGSQRILWFIVRALDKNKD